MALKHGDMFATGALDVAAADDALAVGEQHDLEQHGGRVSRCSSVIVAESRIEVGQVYLVIQQVVQSMFDGTGDELPCRSTASKRGLVSMCL